MNNISTAWKTRGSSKVWTEQPFGVPSTLQITVDKPQETRHSMSLQALPRLQRCSHPHLNPNDLLTKLTINLSTVGGNDIWGVGDTPMPAKSYFSVAGSKKRGELLLPHGTSLLFSLQRHGRYQGKEMKYSEKAFKSKLNPINDSFKRSIPYIYKSTFDGIMCNLAANICSVTEHCAGNLSTHLLSGNSSL